MMSAVSLHDLLAQASVDPELEARLVAHADNLEALVDMANAAGYAVTIDDFLALNGLSDQELADVVGGFTPYDDKNKCVVSQALLASINRNRLIQ